MDLRYRLITAHQETGRLDWSIEEAADLMEEALNKWPDLRSKFEYQLKLWRRGIVR